MANGKIKGSIFMVFGILLAIIYALGSVLDLFFNTIGNNPYWDQSLWFGGIDWLDWRLFSVLPLWLVITMISLMVIWLGYATFRSKSSDYANMFQNEGFGKMLQGVDGYGKLLGIEEIIETEKWQEKWPVIQALGIEYTDEKDEENQVKLWYKINQELEALGKELVSVGVLPENTWQKRLKELEEFEMKVVNKQTTFMDKMYLKWLFRA
ncbi:MAG: hypothetical protein ACXAEU_00030 [Candidatus Hodarchaeales archaeon]|jgi:hypothetical protein